LCKNGPKATHRRKSKEEFLGTILKHPAYSPDLVPSDLFLFQKIKEILKERHFDVTMTSGIIQWQL